MSFYDDFEGEDVLSQGNSDDGELGSRSFGNSVGRTRIRTSRSKARDSLGEFGVTGRESLQTHHEISLPNQPTQTRAACVYEQ